MSTMVFTAVQTDRTMSKSMPVFFSPARDSPLILMRTRLYTGLASKCTNSLSFLFQHSILAWNGGFDNMESVNFV